MAKTAAQLDREIASALVTGKEQRAPVTAKRLTKTQINKLRSTLRKTIKWEQDDVASRSREMTEENYQRAGEDAIRIAGLSGLAACQAGDNGTEIWEVIPGVGAVGDQIAEYHQKYRPYR